MLNIMSRVQQASWSPSSLKASHVLLVQRRCLHSQSLREVSTAAPTHQGTVTTASVSPASTTTNGHPRPLSLLPLPNLLRSYALTALSSYPLLLTPSLRMLSFIAHSSSALLNPDRNPLLHWMLKKTFYAQFCAGETTLEVQKTVQGLKNMGFQGVILAYGKEIVLEKGEKIDTSVTTRTVEEASRIARDVHAWKEGTLKTVEMAEDGDFIGLKFSGAGHDAMLQLAAEAPPSQTIESATTAICDLAVARGVRLLFDAEQDAVQRGIDAWTLRFQERYNKSVPGRAVVYGTYQAYLRSTPTTLVQHLNIAKREGFTLGVKLVRGAYMASDPRSLFWSTKQDTDQTYDGITEALLKRRWNRTLRSSSTDSNDGMAEVAFVLASHNQETVRKAMSCRKEQTRKGNQKIDLAYGQLMGMADEVSCELVMAANTSRMITSPGEPKPTGPRAYKYLVWGSIGECVKYLVRRAEENRDAVIRAKGTRRALLKELQRRIWG